MRRAKQQVLRFSSSPTGWGGARVGAGRKPGGRTSVAHASREGFASRHPCLVTVKVRPDVPSLRAVRAVREIEAAFRKAPERRGCRLTHYSIQGNHLHLVVEAAGPEGLGTGMKSLLSRFARAVNRAFSRRGPVLADRYHSRALKTPREVRNALAYVLLNARRHARRLSKRVGMKVLIDPASSGRWFEGWRRAVEPARDPPAVALPRTWLLKTAWRRHGLIRSEEVPGRA